MIKILKKTMWTKMAFLLAGFCLVSPTVMTKIVVYPVPKGVYYRMHNDDFTVKVRQAGTDQEQYGDLRFCVERGRNGSNARP